MRRYSRQYRRIPGPTERLLNGVLFLGMIGLGIASIVLYTIQNFF